MPGLALLDVALGLTFLFLVLSLIVSALQEGIAALLDMRAHLLRKKILQMLDGDVSMAQVGSVPGLGREIMAHPLIRTLETSGISLIGRLFRSGDLSLRKKSDRRAAASSRGPSYIPPETFAKAMVATLRTRAGDEPIRTAEGAADPLRSASGVRLAVGSLPRDTAAMLAPLVEEAERRAGRDGLDPIEALETQIGAWFDGCMDRVSGWYKRKSQWIMLVIGIGLAATLNIDPIHITSQLVRDPEARLGLIEQAAAYVNARTDIPEEANAINAELSRLDQDVVAYIRQLEDAALPFGWPQFDERLREKACRIELAGGQTGSAPKPASAAAITDQQGLRVAESQMEASLAQVRACQQRLIAEEYLPALWEDPVRYVTVAGKSFTFWQTLFGWLIAGIATSLGAAFWFDALQRILRIRNAGRTPANGQPPGGAQRQA